MLRKLMILICFLGGFSVVVPVAGSQTASNGLVEEANRVFFPLISAPNNNVLQINAPFFDGDIRFSETAIFWFGQVNLTDNYADVRIGYNADELYIRIAAFDRRLWYDTEPSITDFSAWDSVSLYLNLVDDLGGGPTSSSYRFDAQLNWWEPRSGWQVAFQGDGSDWVLTSIPFTTKSGWRGNAPNDDADDRGWTMTYRIPFSSLGLSTTPSQGTKWDLGVVLYDRDDPAGTPIPGKFWPPEMDSVHPKTWGKLVFGLPSYSPNPSSSMTTTIIRHGLNGAIVVDAHVGGHTTCGAPYAPDYFDGWGEANYAGYSQINIQNQSDVADWPCFSKYYVTFPLELIPQGKVILSATLRMFLFGNSGQGWEPAPQPSLIQVSSVASDWEESVITWNNAPLPLQNFSYTWVEPVDSFPDYPGVPYEWDVSQAVADAYSTGEPVRLVLYTPDANIHSGKYFYASDIDEWNAEGRPTLEVIWGDP